MEICNCELCAAARRKEPLTELLMEVAHSGVEFDDPRIGYVVVQINRVTWDDIQKWKRGELCLPA